MEGWKRSLRIPFPFSSYLAFPLSHVWEIVFYCSISLSPSFPSPFHTRTDFHPDNPEEGKLGIARFDFDLAARLLSPLLFRSPPRFHLPSASLASAAVWARSSFCAGRAPPSHPGWPGTPPGTGGERREAEGDGRQPVSWVGCVKEGEKGWMCGRRLDTSIKAEVEGGEEVGGTAPVKRRGGGRTSVAVVATGRRRRRREEKSACCT